MIPDIDIHQRRIAAMRLLPFPIPGLTVIESAPYEGLMGSEDHDPDEIGPEMGTLPFVEQERDGDV